MNNEIIDEIKKRMDNEIDEIKMRIECNNSNIRSSASSVARRERDLREFGEIGKIFNTVIENTNQLVKIIDILNKKITQLESQLQQK